VGQGRKKKRIQREMKMGPFKAEKEFRGGGVVLSKEGMLA